MRQKDGYRATRYDVERDASLWEIDANIGERVANLLDEISGSEFVQEVLGTVDQCDRVWLARLIKEAAEGVVDAELDQARTGVPYFGVSSLRDLGAALGMSHAAVHKRLTK